VEKTQDANSLNLFLEAYLNYAFHELATPLTVLYSYAQLVEDNLPEDAGLDSIRRFVSKIVQQGDRTVDMLNEFLEATRLLCGTMKLDRITMPPLNLFTQIFEERWANQLEAVTIEIGENVAKTNLRLDAPRMKQAFDYLIDFVIHSQLEYGAVPSDKIYGHLKLTVDDFFRVTIHIPELILDELKQTYLFDFYRPLRTDEQGSLVQPKAGRSGMGLFIAHGIVKLHGGELAYNSDLPGFLLQLPLDND
jgi:signal transduction histidine kinase